MTRTFLRGLGIVLPLAATVWILVWLATRTEAALKPLFTVLLPDAYYLPGLGVLFGIVMVYVVGLLIELVPVRFLWEYFQRLLERIPVVKTLYSALSDFFDFFSSSPADAPSTVVSVNMGQDIRLIGFVTDRKPVVDRLLDDKVERIAVYLPMSYQIGGYTLLVPPERVSPLDISVEDAMRLVLTAGIQKRD